MERQKDQFLIDTDRYNVVQKRLYDTDLPAAHDDFQMLSRSTVRQFVDLSHAFCAVQKESLERLQQGVDQESEAVATINVDADQAAFVNMYSASKLASWQLPASLHFEECPVWHDTVRLDLLRE